MDKIAFVFPGQGSQYIGMGKDFIAQKETSRKVFEQAKETLDFDLEKLCFTENQLIHETAYTQPALLAISIAILRGVEALGIKPDYVAGLSLGEYSALVANKGIAFEDALRLVRKRGIFMEEAAAKTKGSMAAILGIDREKVLKACHSVEGIVEIANYNSPSQLVIAGESAAVEQAKHLLEKKGRVISLNVSGAFHSVLMEEASKRLEEALRDVVIHKPTIPYACNITGEIIEEEIGIKELLTKQVKASVRWEECVRSLMDAGVTTFIEIGPGKTLSGLIKKIDRKNKVYSIENIEGLNQLKSALEV